MSRIIDTKENIYLHFLGKELTWVYLTFAKAANEELVKHSERYENDTANHL